MKLLGNRVMLQRVEENQTSSGFIVADPYNKGQITFEVLAIGPGEQVKNPRSKRSVFISPEMRVGDRVLSTHWTEASEHQSWHQPQYLDHEDGRGRVILDARFCILAWAKPPETSTFSYQSHL